MYLKSYHGINKKKKKSIVFGAIAVASLKKESAAAV